MIKMLKLAAIAAITAASIASPALAQSFNPRDGSGNVLPFSYGVGGTRLSRSASAAPDQSGLHAFAMIPRDPQRDPQTATNNGQGLTGGGSAGYNALLLQH